MRTITRTTNPNGTYRYEIDGAVIYKASKVLYTHASSYTVGTENDPILFHKTERAANKATGYRNNGWVKTGVQAIEDGDAAAPAPAVDEPAADTRCVTCVAHPGWAHANEAQRREPQDICRDCLGSGLESVAKTRRAPAVEPANAPRLRGTKVEYLHAATGQWRPATVTGYRAHQDTYVLATDHGSDAAVAGDVRTPAPEAPKVPRVRAKVVANAGPSHLRGRQGRVESKGRGDDGELYVTVEFEPGVTWPFLVSELTLV